MDAAYKKSFLKDLQKLPAESRSRIQTFALQEASAAASMTGLGRITKITGYPTYFRKRFGNYRVGFKFEKGKSLFTEFSTAVRFTVIFRNSLSRNQRLKHHPSNSTCRPGNPAKPRSNVTNECPPANANAARYESVPAIRPRLNADVKDFQA